MNIVIRDHNTKLKHETAWRFHALWIHKIRLLTTGMKLFNNSISPGTTTIHKKKRVLLVFRKFQHGKINKHHLMQFLHPIITTRRRKTKARDRNAFCLEATNQTEY